MENYDTVCRLGLGACGDVFLARDRRNKMLFALKRVKLDESRKTRTKDAVLKEARILSQLKHPHIVTYHESFFDQEGIYLYIAQDYCDGGTLEDKISEARNRHKHLNEKQILQWFVQLTLAAQHIHSRKVLHRDLKSQNVFLTKKGIVKLGDFGISKALDSTIDQACTVVGTPCYLSPELCQDIPYSSKSDIWALGCLLYEMCALKPAFEANNLMGLFMKIVKAEYQPLPAEFSDEVKCLVAFILNKCPDSRPSASEILNEPIVKQQLGVFVEEKETLLQQYSAKDTQPKLSPLAPTTRLSTPGGLVDKETVLAKSLAESAAQMSYDTCSPRPSAQTDTADQLEEADSQYSDDFDSSEDEQDTCSDAVVVSQPVCSDACSGASGSGADGWSCNQEEDYSYPDDFEEDDIEDLGELVSVAREAQSVLPRYEVVMDETEDGISLRQQWYDVLGEKRFEEMKQIVCSPEADGRLSVNHRIGEEGGEICYLTSNGMGGLP